MEYQTDTEFAALRKLYAGQPQRRRVLEIGSMLGDTLRAWLELGEPGLTLISVDKVVPPADGRHAEQRHAHETLWPQWASDRRAILTVLDADSRAAETITSVKAALKGEPLDFLFIDGGHDYATVKADYENYAPLVRPGGLIAFHDIQGIADVAQFWREVRAGKTTGEFCATGGWGIGYLYTPDTRPVLHVITACSRPENLPLLAESLRAANLHFKLHWWILTMMSAPGCPAHLNCGGEIHQGRILPADPVGGKAQLNFALDEIQKRPIQHSTFHVERAMEWVWVLDDDNVAHPDFFPTLAREIAPGVRGIAFAQQARSGGIRPVGPEWMKECSIDQAQFVLRRDLIGTARYPIRYTADGAFAERLFREAPDGWKFCQSPVTYYNWLK